MTALSTAEQIVAGFNGINLFSLARRYHLEPREVYLILRDHWRATKARRGLPDEGGTYRAQGRPGHGLH